MSHKQDTIKTIKKTKQKLHDIKNLSKKSTPALYYVRSKNIDQCNIDKAECLDLDEEIKSLKDKKRRSLSDGIITAQIIGGVTAASAAFMMIDAGPGALVSGMGAGFFVGLFNSLCYELSPVTNKFRSIRKSWAEKHKEHLQEKINHGEIIINTIDCILEEREM